MKKFVTLLTKKNRKMATNEQENDASNILQTLYSVYKKIRTILFPCLLVNLFKQRCISSVKSYVWSNISISIKTMVSTF